jgi:hypothetical protein
MGSYKTKELTKGLPTTILTIQRDMGHQKGTIQQKDKSET